MLVEGTRAIGPEKLRSKERRAVLTSTGPVMLGTGDAVARPSVGVIVPSVQDERSDGASMDGAGESGMVAVGELVIGKSVVEAQMTLITGAADLAVGFASDFCSLCSPCSPGMPALDSPRPVSPVRAAPTATAVGIAFLDPDKDGLSAGLEGPEIVGDGISILSTNRGGSWLKSVTIEGLGVFTCPDATCGTGILRGRDAVRGWIDQRTGAPAAGESGGVEEIAVGADSIFEVEAGSAVVAGLADVARAW